MIQTHLYFIFKRNFNGTKQAQGGKLSGRKEIQKRRHHSREGEEKQWAAGRKQDRVENIIYHDSF